MDMKSLADEAEDLDELDQITQGMEQESTDEQQVSEVENGSASSLDKIKDVLLQNTKHRDLEQYQPSDYNLPESQGSKRLLRAGDTLLKDNLETVLTDVVIGVFDLAKNLKDERSDTDGIGSRPESGQQPAA